MTSGQYIVDDKACLAGTVCSLMYNFKGPSAVPNTAYCMLGNKTSETIRTVLFGPDAETRFPGDICVANVTECYGKGKCVNGVC